MWTSIVATLSPVGRSTSYATALVTFPALRHRVHTYARWAFPFRRTRTRWRFGSKRRFVATIEWLRLLPKLGFFPQIAQTFDIAPASVAADRGIGSASGWRCERGL